MNSKIKQILVDTVSKMIDFEGMEVMRSKDPKDAVRVVLVFFLDPKTIDWESLKELHNLIQIDSRKN